MSADSSMQALLSRGRLLREHGRHEEAERMLADALRVDPNDATVLCEIAFCRMGIKGRLKDALEAIDRALALDPGVAYYHAVRSLILHDLRQYENALDSASTAISLDPDEAVAHLARAHALFGLERWADSETSVRRALEIDPDYAAAHNMLSVLLRTQNRQAENAGQVQFLLERNPDDTDAHANAGWAALHSGDGVSAQTHFLESLRLDPENEVARQGLLEAYKSRSCVYRWYLSYCMFMTRFTRAQRWAIIIGILIAARFLRGLAALVGPYWALAVAGAYLLLVLWSHLARSVGNFLVLIDRVARHALRLQERCDGFVGGLVLTGVALGVAGVLLKYPLLGLSGAFLLVLSIPLSKVFLNNSTLGRWVFGSISVLVIAAGLVHIMVPIVPALSDVSDQLVGAALIGTMMSTFLGSVSALRR